MANFREMAQETCNGCDLITEEENKLTTEAVLKLCKDKGHLTLDDFATCTIEGKKVGVVTFVEAQGKYYWGGQSLTNMVCNFVTMFRNESEAREAYEMESQKVEMMFEMTKTKNKQDFLKCTVL